MVNHTAGSCRSQLLTNLGELLKARVRASFRVFRTSAFSAKPRPSRIVQHKRAPNTTFVRNGSTHENHHAAQHTGSNIIAQFFRGTLISSHAYDQSKLERRRAEAEKILLARSRWTKKPGKSALLTENPTKICMRISDSSINHASLVANSSYSSARMAYPNTRKSTKRPFRTLYDIPIHQRYTRYTVYLST